MITSDANFEAHAEVHVPTMCERPDDLRKGCLFPGARNYDPGAVQSDKCLYRVRGCTDASALNYNSEASDDDGSCILPVRGCTLRPDADYLGVDPSTPMYKVTTKAVDRARALSSPGLPGRCRLVEPPLTRRLL